MKMGRIDLTDRAQWSNEVTGEQLADPSGRKICDVSIDRLDARHSGQRISNNLVTRGRPGAHKMDLVSLHRQRGREARSDVRRATVSRIEAMDDLGDSHGAS